MSKVVAASGIVTRGWFLGLALVLVLLNCGTARADAIALAQTVQAGGTADFTLELRNDTAVSHTYIPTVTGLPDQLVVAFSQGGPLIEQVDILAHAGAPVLIRVDTPRDTSVGTYAGQFTAVRDDGASLQLPVTLIVENTYALQITDRSLNLTVFSGQETTFDLVAANTGAAPVTHVTLRADAPAKWLIQTDPAQVDALAPGDSITFHTRMLLPPSQVPVDQPVKFTAAADQVSSADATLVVRVQKSPDFLYAASAVTALAVAGAVVYFRLHGRR